MLPLLLSLDKAGHSWQLGDVGLAESENTGPGGPGGNLKLCALEGRECL